jgi:hypothetical protein
MKCRRTTWLTNNGISKRASLTKGIALVGCGVLQAGQRVKNCVVSNRSWSLSKLIFTIALLFSLQLTHETFGCNAYHSSKRRWLIQRASAQKIENVHEDHTNSAPLYEFLQAGVTLGKK